MRVLGALLTVYFVATVQCDDVENSTFEKTIAGGTAATADQFPWHAIISTSLAYKLPGNSMCGGSLIAPRWILTAATCIYGLPRYNIGLGSITRNTQPIKLTSDTAFVHPEFNLTTGNNDIGLIKLPSRVQLQKNIQVIRLPSRGQASTSFNGSIVTVPGFGGANATAILKPSPILMYTEQIVVNNSVCIGTSQSNQTILCMQGHPDKKNGPCWGDVGGAIVLKEGNVWTQIGVVSYYGSKCAVLPGSYGVRTAATLTWIQKTTGIVIR